MIDAADELANVDRIMLEIGDKLADFKIQSYHPDLREFHGRKVIEQFRIEHHFDTMRDQWVFTVYGRVWHYRFRMDGVVNSEDLFSRHASTIVMSQFWEFLLTMQTEYWAEWIKVRDA